MGKLGFPGLLQHRSSDFRPPSRAELGPRRGFWASECDPVKPGERRGIDGIDVNDVCGELVMHTFRHVSLIFTWVKTSIHWQNHMFLSLFVQWQGAYSLWAFLTVRHGAKTTGGWCKNYAGNPKTLHPRLYLYYYIMLISQIQINIKTTI